MNKEHLGRWDIESMKMWSKDYIDCNEPGYVLINADGTGAFVFGAVTAGIDGDYCKETERFEYSWEGLNDGDPVCGRGWFKFESPELASGNIYIHMGDESSIVITR